MPASSLFTPAWLCWRKSGSDSQWARRLIFCARAESTGSDKQAADTGHSPGPDGWARDRRPRRLLIVDRVGRVELVVGLRSHTGEVLSVYLTDVDVEKLSEGTA